MGQYYYAVSSLPHLYYDSETFPSDEVFLTLCAENLSKSDLRAVMNADKTDGTYPGSALIEKWREWNLSLRADLATLQAQRQGRSADEYQRIERVSGTEELARDAFNTESPLAAEDVIERGRWAELDELEVGHFFDVGKLIVYRLKISILERKAMFDLNAGLENFGRIYDVVTEEKLGVQPE